MEKPFNNTFPFSAVVGQDDLKLALLLNSIDPSLGGVLAIGDKGTGKTTLIRSLSALMNTKESFPFINLPIGASEDRVLGHINLETLINDKKEAVEQGLLAKADRGFLYVDEINLLSDYLTDVLLDAASSGSYHLEREGMSKTFNSRFCLIGSMNPEEGNLRPQLKDRFGLSVIVTTPNDIALRTTVIKNRLAFDDNPEQFLKQFKDQEEQLYLKIKAAKIRLKIIELPSELYEVCASIAHEHLVEGLRADILLMKTARAYAAFLGKSEMTKKDIEVIAPFVLNHRSNTRKNEDQSPANKNKPEQESNSSEGTKENNKPQPEHTFESLIPSTELNFKTSNTSSKSGSDTVLNSVQNRSIAVHSSAEKNKDTRKTVGQYLATNTLELKYKVSQNKTTKHIIFLLDSSGSMRKDNSVAYAKGLIEKAVRQEKNARLTFSLLSLYDNDVSVMIKGSQDIETLIQELQALKTGGKTNVISAFKKIKTLTVANASSQNELVIITDGRFNSKGINDFDNAVTAYQTFCKSINQLTIVDAETGIVKLGLAKQFAEKVKGNYELLEL
ncbi:AAA family ATPase [uncultured Aquimarina sp.]|uniref:AAA family ATPase n=1 Tax=uncultured Aquimarina sp. TaxID=575652 RepID=UPI00262BCF57|nr:AAA family ATPase [uncultured Aquimarina sp.]